MKSNEMGTVKFYNYSKGFGFIERECGSDIFVQLNCELGITLGSLQKGQRVSFSSVKYNGNEQAKNITILEPPSS